MCCYGHCMVSSARSSSVYYVVKETPYRSRRERIWIKDQTTQPNTYK